MLRRLQRQLDPTNAGTFGMSLAATLLIAAVAPLVSAQYMVPQDGRLFEVNTMVGGGFDYTRPVSPLMSGNPFATGNVGRGLSLRSYSPIASTSTFRASLGSDSLSNFIRDSISPSAAYSPSAGLFASPYYDPARTVPSAGYLQGYYDFRPGVADQSYINQWPSAGVAPGMQILAQPGQQPAVATPYDLFGHDRSRQLGQPYNAALSSSIFGVPGPQFPGVSDNALTLPNANFVPRVGFDNWGMPRVEEPTVEPERLAVQPLDLRITPSSPIESHTPIDTALLPATPGMPPSLPTELTPAVNFPVQPGVTFRPGATTSGGLVPPGMELRPGGDIYTDMRMALELSLNPQADWFQAMQDAVGQGSQDQAVSPTDAVQRQLRAVDAAAEFLTKLFESPLETFAGSDPSAANQEIRQAEAAMDVGRYYDAVRFYERAAAIAPGNPLPLIGQGHALLAAGEYLSAAMSLIAGLDRFPDLSRFQVDLVALMGGGEIVDIRRADLMRMLERREDPQLRFLLGYLETNTGMADSGLQHLEKAAEDAPPGSILRRYPELVRYKLYTGARRSDGSPTPFAPTDPTPIDPASEPPGEQP